MIKVHILDRCKHRDGQANLPNGESKSYTGEKYMQYETCPKCQGSGKQAIWICFKEIADLIERVISCEYLTTQPPLPAFTSHFSLLTFHFSLFTRRPLSAFTPHLIRFTHYALRFTHYVLRFTHYVLRFTPHSSLVKTLHIAYNFICK